MDVIFRLRRRLSMAASTSTTYLYDLLLRLSLQPASTACLYTASLHRPHRHRHRPFPAQAEHLSFSLCDLYVLLSLGIFFLFFFF